MYWRLRRTGGLDYVREEQDLCDDRAVRKRVVTVVAVAELVATKVLVIAQTCRRIAEMAARRQVADIAIVELVTGSSLSCSRCSPVAEQLGDSVALASRLWVSEWYACRQVLKW